MIRLRSVDFIDPADVVVCDLNGRPSFGRQPPLKARLRALDGAAMFQSRVNRFIDHPHSALAQLAEDAEAIVYCVARFKWSASIRAPQ